MLPENTGELPESGLNFAPLGEGDREGLSTDGSGTPQVVAAENSQGSEVDQGKQLAGEAAGDSVEGPQEDDKGEGSEDTEGGESSDTEAEHPNTRRRPRLKRDEVRLALKAAEGQFGMAALAIGCTEQAIRAYVARDAELSALWTPNPDSVSEPSGLEILMRSSAPMPASRPKPDQNAMAEMMLIEDREILRQGLEAAGIRRETIQKLGLMEGFAKNTGRFLGAALDLTHKLTVFQGVSLFERAEYIKTHYLENETYPDEMKIEWQKAYNECCELIAKTSDRVLVGTTAVVNVLKERDKEKGKKGDTKAVGFEPLQRK